MTVNSTSCPGIILAGGTGSRLFPLTSAMSKQLLPVYDKPMIYYPIATLMAAGITEFLMITNPEEVGSFERLLGDGSQWGITIEFAIQPEPNGIAESFLIGRDFLCGRGCVLILGDNLFYGSGLARLIQAAIANTEVANIFVQKVARPDQYGVVSFDEDGTVTNIVEKPENPTSSWAATGLYVYPSDVVDVAKRIAPSPRGELEITDINRHYLSEAKLEVSQLGNGYAWLDTGTFDSLVQASEFVRVLELRQRLKVGSPEEIAFQMNYITAEELVGLADPLKKSGYGASLLEQAQTKNPTG